MCSKQANDVCFVKGNYFMSMANLVQNHFSIDATFVTLFSENSPKFAIFFHVSNYGT